MSGLSRVRIGGYVALVVVLVAIGYVIGRAVAPSSPGLLRFSIVPVSIPPSARIWYGYAGVGGSLDLTQCSWPGPVPKRWVPSAPGYFADVATACDPILPGKTFGLLEAQENQSEALLVAYLDRSTRAVSVGPVLATYPGEMGLDLQVAVADGSIWVYLSSARTGTEAFRLSVANGSVLQRSNVPQASGSPIAANDDGLWLDGSGGDGSAPGVYVVPFGASRAQLVQPTTNPVWEMTGSGQTMTIVEGANSLSVEYRFVLDGSSG